MPVMMSGSLGCMNAAVTGLDSFIRSISAAALTTRSLLNNSVLLWLTMSAPELIYSPGTGLDHALSRNTN